MNDDFNTPEAIAVLFDLANETNKKSLKQGADLLKDTRRNIRFIATRSTTIFSG